MPYPKFEFDPEFEIIPPKKIWWLKIVNFFTMRYSDYFHHPRDLSYRLQVLNHIRKHGLPNNVDKLKTSYVWNLGDGNNLWLSTSGLKHMNLLKWTSFSTDWENIAFCYAGGIISNNAEKETIAIMQNWLESKNVNPKDEVLSRG